MGTLRELLQLIFDQQLTIQKLEQALALAQKRLAELEKKQEAPPQ